MDTSSTAIRIAAGHQSAIFAVSTTYISSSSSSFIAPSPHAAYLRYGNAKKKKI